MTMTRKKTTARTRQSDLKVLQPAATTDQSEPLGKRAMLVKVSASIWRARVKDNAATQQVIANNNAQSDAGDFWKQLVDKALINKVNRAFTNVGREHRRLTAPWRDDAWRIISSDHFLDYCARLRGLAQETEAALEEMLAAYPSAVAKQSQRLGGMFNPSEYPSVAELRERYSLRIDSLPVSDADDFRCGGIDEETLAELRNKLDDENRALLAGAVRDQFVRLQEVVSDMIARLKAYAKTDEKVEHTFRDTIVTNIEKVLAVIPALNAITQDPEIDQVVARIRSELCFLTADELRQSSEMRQSTVDKAKAISDHMAQFI